jgi:hypothetical protein
VAVRQEIEQCLARAETPCLMVIDFSQVSLLDFSCADEIIGKLLDGMRQTSPSREAYIILRGARYDHREAIESAIERYQLAVIVEEPDGTTSLLGPLDDRHRRAWDAVRRLGRVAPDDLVNELEEPPDSLAQTLDTLWERRLVMRDDEGYVSLQTAS